MESHQIKQAIRKELKARLKAIPPADRAQRSRAVVDRLLALSEYQQARTLLLFVSLTSEVDTSPAFVHARAAGKRLAVPRTSMADHSMQAVLIEDVARDMVQTRIGVLEPKGGALLDPAEIDLIVVPGLGFGPHGERIGRGAGFYDRFLNSAPRAVRCAIAMHEQVIAEIPMTVHDAWLDILVTDQEVLRFGRGL